MMIWKTTPASVPPQKTLTQLLLLDLGLALGLVLGSGLTTAGSIAAQSGLEMGKMWTFEDPPLAYLEEEYGFSPDQKWLDSLRLASLRFGGGCSASFVSPKGLIMTNHHCVRGDIANNQGENDWVKDGFYARSHADEVPLKGLTVQQLISMEDVTDRINEGIATGDDDATVAEKLAANQRKVIAAAKEQQPDLDPQVIKMHQGALYQLYSYKVYTDIRLVVAPHLQTAHFGGDPDNFTYPRFGIDFAFCRAYEGGEPADTSAHYFRWSKHGPQKGELAFVTGNPGSTGRLLTQGQMSFLAQTQYPILLDQFADELRIVKKYAAKDAAYEKQTRSSVLGLENSQKAITGYLDGLKDPALQEAKRRAETAFRAKVAADPELQARYGQAWEELEKIAKEKIALFPRSSFYVPSYSNVLRRAEAVVRATDATLSEKARTDATQMATGNLRKSPAGRELAEAHLARARKWLGDGDPYVQMLIGELAPEQAVDRLEEKTILNDKAKVQELLDGGRAAVEASADLAIRAALHFTRERAKIRAQMQELQTRENVQGAKIGRALFAVYGNKVSPDATFSLRFSDGRVEGFPYNGTIAPYRTTFYGLYGRNAEFDNTYPFDLPPIWLEREDRIDMRKGVNFVATNDIIGGNSGSPMVNKEQEVIGLIFDGNIEMLGNRFLYRDDVPRSVSVHSEAIMEAMMKIYDADRIVQEIEDAAKQPSGGKR